MSQRFFYHNISQREFNLDNIEDVVLSMVSEYDIIMYSEAGNALILQLDEDMEKEISKLFKEEI